MVSTIIVVPSAPKSSRADPPRLSKRFTNAAAAARHIMNFEERAKRMSAFGQAHQKFMPTVNGAHQLIDKTWRIQYSVSGKIAYTY